MFKLRGLALRSGVLWPHGTWAFFRIQILLIHKSKQTASRTYRELKRQDIWHGGQDVWIANPRRASCSKCDSKLRTRDGYRPNRTHCLSMLPMTQGQKTKLAQWPWLRRQRQAMTSIPLRRSALTHSKGQIWHLPYSRNNSAGYACSFDLQAWS